MHDELAGRVALVTGASRGLGRAIALALAHAGCAVAVNHRTSPEAADAVVAEIQAAGGIATTIAADVAVATLAEALVAETARRLGPVAIVVNNAGIGPRRALLDATPAEFDDVIAANLRSAFLVTQAALPGMVEAKWGRLVFLSSIASRTGGVIGAAYAASKAGVEGLMHYYAAQGAPHGITANAVAPAFIATDMLAGVPLPPPAQMPLGRMGRAEEVADLVVATLRAGYLTGQTLHLNAGRYMT